MERLLFPFTYWPIYCLSQDAFVNSQLSNINHNESVSFSCTTSCDYMRSTVWTAYDATIKDPSFCGGISSKKKPVELQFIAGFYNKLKQEIFFLSKWNIFLFFKLEYFPFIQQFKHFPFSNWIFPFFCGNFLFLLFFHNIYRNSLFAPSYGTECPSCLGRCNVSN